MLSYTKLMVLYTLLQHFFFYLKGFNIYYLSISIYLYTVNTYSTDIYILLPALKNVTFYKEYFFGCVNILSLLSFLNICIFIVLFFYLVFKLNLTKIIYNNILNNKYTLTLLDFFYFIIFLLNLYFYKYCLDFILLYSCNKNPELKSLNLKYKFIIFNKIKSYKYLNYFYCKINNLNKIYLNVVYSKLDYFKDNVFNKLSLIGSYDLLRAYGLNYKIFELTFDFNKFDSKKKVIKGKKLININFLRAYKFDLNEYVLYKDFMFNFFDAHLLFLNFRGVYRDMDFYFTNYDKYKFVYNKLLSLDNFNKLIYISKFKVNFRYSITLLGNNLNNYIISFSSRNFFYKNLSLLNNKSRFFACNFFILNLIKNLNKNSNYLNFFIVKNFSLTQIIFLKDFFKYIYKNKINIHNIMFNFNLTFKYNKYNKKLKTKKKFKKKIYQKNFQYDFKKFFIYKM